MFKTKSKIDKFWSWFAANADRYYRLDANPSRLMTELKRELDKVAPGLTVEFRSVGADARRELIVSANGIVNLFPLVTNLVNRSPKLDQWQITAFRQPREIDSINIAHHQIKMEEVFFSFGKANGKLNVVLFFNQYDDSPEWPTIVFILLDSLLGEHSTEMDIGSIEAKAIADAQQPTMLLPISALPQLVRKHRQECGN